MKNKLNSSCLICGTLNAPSWHSWKEAEGRGLGDLPEGQARGEASGDCSAALCVGGAGGLQRHSKQLRTHFGPNLNPFSHSVISPYKLMLRTCVCLCLTLCATLHYPAAKFSPPPPPPPASGESPLCQPWVKTRCPHHKLSNMAGMFSC